MTSEAHEFEGSRALQKLIELGLTDLELWWIMEPPFAQRYAEGLAKRYPERELMPFAKRNDNDDIACFEASRPGKVEVIHDFASPGFEQRAEYDDLWAWFLTAVQEMVDREREEEQE